MSSYVARTGQRKQPKLQLRFLDVGEWASGWRAQAEVTYNGVYCEDGKPAPVKIGTLSWDQGEDLFHLELLLNGREMRFAYSMTHQGQARHWAELLAFGFLHGAGLPAKVAP